MTLYSVKNDSIVTWGFDSSVGLRAERSVNRFPTTTKDLFLSSPKRLVALEPDQSGIQWAMGVIFRG